MLEELRTLGVDVDGLLELFGGDVDAYCEILQTFLSDLESYDVVAPLSNGEYEKACQNAHALKGAAGNLRMQPLFEMYTQINNALKNSDVDTAKAVLEAGIEKQQKIVECIKNNK